jgi:Na+-driven multidrug efflux pump
MTYGLNHILLSFTAAAAAVYGVYFRLQGFIFMPVLGLNDAMVPIIAFNYGARNKERIIKTIKSGALYATSIMVIGFLAFELFPDKLLLMFNAGAEMLAIGITAMRILAIRNFFSGFCIVFMAVFLAMGNAMENLLVSVARQLVVLLPAAWLLSLSGSVNAVWWAFPIAEGLSLILSSFFIRRIYNRKIKALVDF